MEAVIRKARPTDIPQIYEAHRKAVEISCAAAYPAEKIKGWVENIQTERYLSGMENGVMLVAEMDGRVKGLGLLFPDKQEVVALYVAPSAQGLWLGGRLLKGLMRAAREEGLERIHLNASLNAASFYRRMSWQEKDPGVQTLSNGTEIECLLFAKNL